MPTAELCGVDRRISYPTIIHSTVEQLTIIREMIQASVYKPSDRRPILPDLS
jgi:hypothetical protein